MEFFFALVTITFCVLILYTDRVNRFLIFLTGITFLPFGIEFIPHMNAPRLIQFAFLFSMIKGSDIAFLRKFPFPKCFLFLFLSYIMTGFMDSRGTLIGLPKAVNCFIETYFLLLIGFVSIRDHKDIASIINWIKLLSIIVGIYSIICFVLGFDFYNSLIGNSDSMQGGSRLRIASFFYDSHVGGFAISIFLLICIADVLYINKFVGIKDIIVIAVLFIALILTGSRSSVLDFLVGLMVMFVPFIIHSRNNHFSRIVILVFLLLIFLIAGGSNLMTKFSDAFQEGGGNTGGSNVSMRIQQLEYSMLFFLKNPIWGNGFNYFWEVIKYEGGFYSSMLLGAESYIFILLIERGAIQIVAVCFFFVSIICYLYKRCKVDAISYVTLAIILAFLTNSIVTGNLYKWPFALPCIGVLVRQIEIREKVLKFKVLMFLYICCNVKQNLNSNL